MHKMKNRLFLNCAALYTVDFILYHVTVFSHHIKKINLAVKVAMLVPCKAKWSCKTNMSFSIIMITLVTQLKCKYETNAVLFSHPSSVCKDACLNLSSSPHIPLETVNE